MNGTCSGLKINHEKSELLMLSNLACTVQETGRWRDLTIIGKIQIVKTFITSIFLYRTSLISLDKEFVEEANKIIFDFIWEGKDKVKRSALISDIEDGVLKVPHLNSIIEKKKKKRILCCKKPANDQPSGWKTIHCLI